MKTQNIKRAKLNDLLKELKTKGFKELADLLDNLRDGMTNSNDYGRYETFDREEIASELELDDLVGSKMGEDADEEDWKRESNNIIDTQLLIVFPDFFEVEWDIW